MTVKSVYLAGPIAGLTYDGAVDWREAARLVLGRHGIDGRSPMRGKDLLREAGVLGTQPYGEHPLASQAGVTTRDRFDCTTSDVVLFNFVGADRVSIGSCIELGWADAARRPIVVAMEGGNPHDHLIVKGVAGFVVPSLSEAISIAVSILA